MSVLKCMWVLSPRQRVCRHHESWGGAAISRCFLPSRECWHGTGGPAGCPRDCTSQREDLADVKGRLFQGSL